MASAYPPIAWRARYAEITEAGELSRALVAGLRKGDALRSNKRLFSAESYAG